MTEIDFYSQVADKFATACRITAKARSQGLRVLIQLSDSPQSEKLDRMLWVTPALSFVPHCQSGNELAAVTPVLLRHFPTSDAAEVLINLTAEVPEDFERFNRVVELVGLDDDDRAAARARWRLYQGRGCDPRNHKLGQEQ